MEQERVLIDHARSKPRAAINRTPREFLRIGRDALRYKLKKHGLKEQIQANSTHSERGTATAEFRFL